MSEAGFEILEWDSSFFGVRVARATASRFRSDDHSLLERAREAKVSCLYFLVDPECSETLTAMADFGCKFVDGRLTLERPIFSEEKDRTRESSVRSARVSDLDRVVDIASSTQWDTRFFKDSRFARERCLDLYVEWISKDLRSDNVLVAVNPENTPLGFLSFKMGSDSERAEICLIAVGENSRGLGVADSMMTSALSLFREKGVGAAEVGAAEVGTAEVGTAEVGTAEVGTAEVVTQASNIAAQRLYQKHGFLSQSLGLWFHLWLD